MIFNACNLKCVSFGSPGRDLECLICYPGWMKCQGDFPDSEQQRNFDLHPPVRGYPGSSTSWSDTSDPSNAPKTQLYLLKDTCACIFLPANANDTYLDTLQSPIDELGACSWFVDEIWQERPSRGFLFQIIFNLSTCHAGDSHYLQNWQLCMCISKLCMIHLHNFDNRHQLMRRIE